MNERQMLSNMFLADKIAYAKAYEELLTKLEFRLLQVFQSHPNEVVTFDDIKAGMFGQSANCSFCQVYGDEYFYTVKHRLQEKHKNGRIESVKGVGYIYHPTREDFSI